jgi:choline dehydrogenase
MYISSALLLSICTLSIAATSTFYPGAGNFFGRPNQNATYDYVVVGGGTAGLAVAMRLAENNSYTVAVVEARGFYQIENGNRVSSQPTIHNFQASTIQPPIPPLIGVLLRLLSKVLIIGPCITPVGKH